MQFSKLFLVFSGFLLIISCSSNKKIAEVISYDSDSTKHIFTYLGKKNELVKETTYFSNGNLKSEYNFSDSMLYGTFSTFNENGNPLKEGFYVNNLENGLFKYFDVNGILTFEGYLKDGKKEGKWTGWYDEVQKKEEMEYSNDMLHGTWIHWYIDGNLMREEFYENGKKIKEQVYE